MQNVNKKIMLISLTFFGLIGSWVGAAVDHNNWFGVWSNVLGIVGTLAGIWIAYLISEYIDP